MNIGRIDLIWSSSSMSNMSSYYYSPDKRIEKIAISIHNLLQRIHEKELSEGREEDLEFDMQLALELVLMEDYGITARPMLAGRRPY